MKFVLPCYGSRGDIEPSVGVGRELQLRGHDVRMAVPPNLVGFTEAAGLAAVAYGLDSQAIVEAQQNYWRCRLRTPWRTRDLLRLAREFGSSLIPLTERGAYCGPRKPAPKLRPKKLLPDEMET